MLQIIAKGFRIRLSHTGILTALYVYMTMPNHLSILSAFILISNMDDIDSMGFVELLLSVKRLYGVNLVDAGLRSADVKSVAALAGKICEAGK